jgi:hypothetical protein
MLETIGSGEKRLLTSPEALVQHLAESTTSDHDRAR